MTAATALENRVLSPFRRILFRKRKYVTGYSFFRKLCRLFFWRSFAQKKKKTAEKKRPNVRPSCCDRFLVFLVMLSSWYSLNLWRKCLNVLEPTGPVRHNMYQRQYNHGKPANTVPYLMLILAGERLNTTPPPPPGSSTVWRPFWSWQCSPARTMWFWLVVSVSYSNILKKLFLFLNLCQLLINCFITRKFWFRILWDLQPKILLINQKDRYWVILQTKKADGGEPCCMVLCKTMQGPKNMCKNTMKTGAGQSLMGGGGVI